MRSCPKGGHRWPPPLYRTIGSRTHRLRAALIPAGVRVRSPLTRHHGLRQTPRSDPARARLPTRRACTPAAFALGCLRSRRSRSRTPPVLGHDRGSSRWRIPGGRRRAVPAPVLVLGIAFRPGRIRHGPSMYEMEGPCPASPPRLASCPALPSAARRPPGPGTRASDRSPGSSRVPGVAPGWCPFPAVKALLLPPQAPRKNLQQAISCFSAIHGRLHREQAVIRIPRRLSTGFSQPIHRFPSVSRRTPQPPVPNARCHVTS